MAEELRLDTMKWIREIRDRIYEETKDAAPRKPSASRRRSSRRRIHTPR
jgi:hypothetical protein